jgi:hypothetical protein
MLQHFLFFAKLRSARGPSGAPLGPRGPRPPAWIGSKAVRKLYRDIYFKIYNLPYCTLFLLCANFGARCCIQRDVDSLSCARHVGFVQVDIGRIRRRGLEDLLMIQDSKFTASSKFDNYPGTDGTRTVHQVNYTQ